MPTAAAAGLTSYGSQICMTNSLRHVKAAPALAMSCAPPAPRCRLRFFAVYCSVLSEGGLTPGVRRSYLSIVLTVAYGFFIFNEVRTPMCSAVGPAEAVRAVLMCASVQVPTPLSVAGAVLILASTAFLGIFVRRQQVASQPHGSYAPLPAGTADAASPPART